MVSPGGHHATYAKVHLYGLEAQTFVAGDVFPIWQTPWASIGPQVCFDVEFPEGPRILGLKGADLLLFPANNLHPYGGWHRIYAAARGLENRAFAATVNRTGVERGDEFCGGSCVMHPNGTWLVKASATPGLKVCDIRITDRHEVDASVNYFRFRRPELYGDVSSTGL